MRVIIDDAVFLDIKYRGTLIQIFLFGFSGRHSILTEPLVKEGHDGTLAFPPCLNAWLNSFALADKETWIFTLQDGIATEALSPEKKTIRISTHAENWSLPIPVVSLESAALFLGMPLWILVENATNDRNFVLVSARSQWRTVFLEAEAKNWLKFDHGGGADMIQQIKNITGIPLQCHRRFVLFDGDALRPGVISKTAEAKKILCQKEKIKFHCLERRAIENYIPLPKLREWAYSMAPKFQEAQKRKQRVDSLSRLSNDQRFHYNFKGGFDKDLKHDDRTTEVDLLYSNVDPTDKEHLKSGINTNIANTLYSEGIREEWLLGDSQRAETNLIVGEILKIL